MSHHLTQDQLKACDELGVGNNVIALTVGLFDRLLNARGTERTEWCHNMPWYISGGKVFAVMLVCSGDHLHVGLRRTLCDD